MVMVVQLCEYSKNHLTVHTHTHTHTHTHRSFWLCVKDGTVRGFPGGPVVKNPPYSAVDTGSIPVRELRSHMHWGN